MEASSLMPLVFLLWAATAAEFAIASNGYLIERREGLRISLFRLLTLAAIFAVATALTIFARTLPQQTAASPAAPTPEANFDAETQRLIAGKQRQQAQIAEELEKIRLEIAAAEGRRSDLQKQDLLLRNEIDRLQGRGSIIMRVIRSIEQFDRPFRIILVMTVLVALVFVGVIILLLGGQIQTLLPEGWTLSGGRAERRALKQKIDEVAARVWDEKYADALDMANAIVDGPLGRFDLLDLKFLRGYCCVQLAAFPAEKDTEAQRQSLIDRAIENLRAVVQQAPKRGEAICALGLAYGLTEKNAEALEMFERAKLLIRGQELPFEHNESVCLLKLAELSLSTGNTEQAEVYFARVARLGS